jgi:DNA-binding HxlR family transcriptional regulator
MELRTLERMERKSFADVHCSLAQCLEVVGEWWSLLIVRDAFLGIKRFDQFQERLGISRNILNRRLAWMVEQGVFEKVRYSERPRRYEYRLTPKGRDLWPVLNAMREWGDEHAAPDGPPLLMVHETCGEVAHAVTACSHCGERLTADNVRAAEGPGDLDGVVATAPAASR